MTAPGRRQTLCRSRGRRRLRSSTQLDIDSELTTVMEFALMVTPMKV